MPLGYGSTYLATVYCWVKGQELWGLHGSLPLGRGLRHNALSCLLPLGEGSGDSWPGSFSVAWWSTRSFLDLEASILPVTFLCLFSLVRMWVFFWVLAAMGLAPRWKAIKIANSSTILPFFQVLPSYQFLPAFDCCLMLSGSCFFTFVQHFLLISLCVGFGLMGPLPEV